MSMPGFAAEFSLYTSDKSYRPTAGSGRYVVRQVVTPQMSCEDYECAPGGQRGWPPPMYCTRCELPQ